MIKALVPVRSGSERVINKNTRSFAGSNLLEIKIKQLLRIKEIDEVCVNSECDEMLSIASSLGATPIKRDPFFATSSVPMNDVYEDFAKNIECDHVLYTNVTSPLVKDDTYRECIAKYFSMKNYDSLNTVTMIKENLWFDGNPINYDPVKHPRSQDLPDIVYLNFAINILPRDLMIKQRNVVGKSFLPYILGKIESLDIDDTDDFELAEIMFLRNKR